MKVEIKNIKGEKVSELELNPAVFDVKFNEALVHQVFVCQYSNKRKAIAHTKDRGERKGSGRKPWRQKGTGRARVGSVRSPLWRKGGIVFGPTNERNFSKKINKKMKKIATAMVISGKIRDKEVLILDKFDYKNNKTKEAQEIIKNNKIKGSILWSYSLEDKDKIKASRNLENSKNILVNNLNVFDMLNNHYLIIDKKGISIMENNLALN